MSLWQETQEVTVNSTLTTVVIVLAIIALLVWIIRR